MPSHVRGNMHAGRQGGRHTRHRWLQGIRKLDLTSMIDVVFLLLIYFMVATEFKDSESVYRLDIPDRTATQDIDPFQVDDEPLRIRVESEGGERMVLAAGYTIQLVGPYEQPESVEELHVFLRERQIGSQARSAVFPPDHPIIILPRSGTAWQHVLEVFDAAVRARYTNVTLGAAGT